MPWARQFRLQRGDEGPVLGVDRADAAEVEVVLGDLFQPLPGDVAAPGDVLQERDDVVRPFRAAEGEHEQRVVGVGGVVEAGGVERLGAGDRHLDLPRRET